MQNDDALPPTTQPVDEPNAGTSASTQPAKTQPRPDRPVAGRQDELTGVKPRTPDSSDD